MYLNIMNLVLFEFYLHLIYINLLYWQHTNNILRLHLINHNFYIAII